MSVLHVIVLAVVQGLTELLPVSSSAHVIVAEKFMGMDPAAPEMTLLLVMLHTGTMLAVIAYFGGRWRRAFFQSAAEFRKFAIALILATVLTGVVGGAITEGIEKVAFRHQPHAWIEQLFDRLDLIAIALALVGILILVAGWANKRLRERENPASGMTLGRASLIGAVQGLCLPFRGFSRSGATISTGMLSGVTKMRSEDFSFALAVVLTPLAIAREGVRLIEMHHLNSGQSLGHAILPSLLGAVLAFLAGLVALKWLSRWLEAGRWHYFGIYCLLAALGAALLHHAGY
jgi:undecaprenyl-diphosphatase